MTIYLLKRNMQEQIHSNIARFFHRIVDSWNLLPYDIRKAVSVNIFKRGVKKFLLDNKKILLLYFRFLY